MSLEVHLIPFWYEVLRAVWAFLGVDQVVFDAYRELFSTLRSDLPSTRATDYAKFIHYNSVP